MRRWDSSAKKKQVPRLRPACHCGLDSARNDSLETKKELRPPAPFAEALERSAAAPHISVRQAETALRIREAGVTFARAERLPNVSLVSSFGQVGYPSSGAFPAPGDFRTNWTLGASVQVPIFTGFRLRANEVSARADLTDATARLLAHVERTS